MAGTVRQEDESEGEKKKSRKESGWQEKQGKGEKKKAEAISGYGKQVDVRMVGGLERMPRDNSMGGMTPGVGVEPSERNRQTIAVKRTGGEAGRRRV